MRFAAVFVSLGLSLGLPAGAATCESLAGLTLPATTISSAQSVAAGAFTPPEGRPIPNLPAFCRVSGTIKPSDDSNIAFEVWLPQSGWNGKFQGIGNGGFAGSIDWRSLGNALAHGYATAATDTGHRAGGVDASWAVGHPQKVVDFGYRAIHETAAQAKAILHAFYGDGPKRSYFNSCSNGGRQALMEAERYPADYDGIIAGAPAISFTGIASEFVWNAQALMLDPASFIPPSKVPAIEAAVVEACDALDGVKDGVIDDPRRCRFDPARMLCKGPDSDSCLTAPQVAALRKIYAGPADSKRKPIYPGMVPGGEDGSGGWRLWIMGAAPGKSLQFLFGTEFYANILYGNPAWDFKTFQAGRDAKIAEEKLAGIMNAANPDLRRFRERGGKLIMYHGWSDSGLTPMISIDYYQNVQEKMGATGDFLRLFMAPGMQHCGGGPGPNSFGQGGVAEGDAQHNIARALERWVEEGVAPDEIIATRYKGAGPASGVERTRPLCAYPLAARWKGSGSTDDAENFVCRK